MNLQRLKAVQLALSPPSADEKTWALLPHVLSLVGGFVGPVVVMVAKGQDLKWVRAYAVESLNFNLTRLIVYAVGAMLAIVLIGLCVLIPAAVASVVLSFIAGLKAYQGQHYRYPLTYQFIKD